MSGSGKKAVMLDGAHGTQLHQTDINGRKREKPYLREKKEAGTTKDVLPRVF